MRRLSLPERYGGRAPAAVEAIDLRAEGPPRGRFIAPRLAEAVNIALGRRRAGAAVPQPPRLRAADAVPALRLSPAMPELRRLAGRAPLHAAAWSAITAASPCRRRPPARNAQATGSFVACGPGVERLEEEAARAIPGARILVLSSDLVASVEHMREELAQIAAGQVDIVIGTQLVAKGHHFPLLNLVGVIDADLGLRHGDPRAAERTFQLLQPGAGRAGRGKPAAASAFLQTHQPEHPVMRALIAQDREAFYVERDRGARAARLAAVRPAREPDRLRTGQARRRKALRGGSARRRRATRASGSLGPAEAPLAIVRGRHRFRLLVKSPRAFDLSAYLREWLAAAPKRKGGRQARGRRRPAELFVRA